jgi:type IV pilus assembly protein PilB
LKVEEVFLKSGIERVIIENNIMTAEEIKTAVVDAQKSKMTFLSALVQAGKVTEDQIVDLLAKRFRVQKIDLDRFKIDPELIKLLPPQLCRKHKVIPVAKSNTRKLVVAFCDPGNYFALDDISMIAQMQIEIVVATESSIDSAIKKYYIPKNADISKMMSDMAGEAGEVVSDIESSSAIDDEKASASDGPIINFVNRMLAEAIQTGVSDIHIEPYEKRLRIRFRLDGSLIEKVQPPQNAASALISRIKIMSKLDIAERRRPQDGRLKVKLSDGKEVDFRVSIIPTLFGEKAVLRILDKSNLNVDLNTIGFSSKDLPTIVDVISRPQGLVLVTGPTGSGKTTTLYSFLDKMNTPDKNISTAEDPVEFNVDGINQIQVHPDIGFDFSAALRSFLRQDPDIIMVGEIRDLETAKIAFKAASTGHLVLSTLHTNDSIATISRIMDMGIPGYVVAETITLVIAQRLMKRNCSKCLESVTIPDESLLQIGVKPADLPKFQKLKKGRGCGTCNNTGLKGRVPIFEILRMTSEVRNSILKGDSPVDMKKKAIADGNFVSLRMSALDRLMAGTTTVEQVLNSSVNDE